MVAIGQDDVLGYCNLSMEQDKLKEKCKTLERENFATEKELDELRQRLSLLTLSRKRWSDTILCQLWLLR